MLNPYPGEVTDLLQAVRPALAPELNERLERLLDTWIALAQGYRKERNDLQDQRRHLEVERDGLLAERQQLERASHHAGRERDLFRTLLMSDEVPSVRAFLNQVLGALIALTGAEKGVFILFSSPGEVRGKPIEVVSRDCDDEDVQTVWEQLELSQGIVRRALSTRAIVYTEEALNDNRFSTQASVKLLQLKTVLCAPLLNTEGKGLGVVYLEHRHRANAFPESDRTLIELVMRHVSRWVDRQLLVQMASGSVDHTSTHRERYGFREIVGRSEGLAEVLRRITLSLDLNSLSPLLITGPDGTGKGLVARALHFNSRRARGPFIVFDCDADDDEQFIEGALFGFAKGAYEGADRNQAGRVEEANGGTLYLREVGALPLAAQDRLVTLLRDRETQRMGETTSRPVDVRVLASSREDLRELIRQQEFRDELFFRLDVYQIKIPPLRERPEDIPLLAEQLIRQLARETGRAIRLSPEAIAWLQELELLENVQELERRLRHAVMLSSDGEITPALLLTPDRPSLPKALTRGALPTWKDATLAFQRQLLADALSRTNRNLQEAAEQLGISRQHLSRLLHELDLNDHRPLHRGRKPRSSHAG